MDNDRDNPRKQILIHFQPLCLEIISNISSAKIVLIYAVFLLVYKSLSREDRMTHTHQLQEAIPSVFASYAEWISTNGGLVSLSIRNLLFIDKSRYNKFIRSLNE